MAELPDAPEGVKFDEEPAAPEGVKFDATPAPPPGVKFDEGNDLIRKAGEILSGPRRLGRALAVGSANALENAPSQAQVDAGAADPADVAAGARGAGERASAAFQPGYKPAPGEAIPSAVGTLAGMAPEALAASAVATAALPALPAAAGLGAVATARVAHGAATFGLMAGVDAPVDIAAQAGRLPTVGEEAKAVGAGTLFGAAMGGAGAIPALVAGRLPASISQGIYKMLIPRLLGAGAEAAVGGGAAAIQGGSKEEQASNAVLYGLLGMLNSSNYDADYKVAALNSAIKPAVDDLVASGMSPADAQARATQGMKDLLVQKVQEHPNYLEAVDRLTEAGVAKGASEPEAAAAAHQHLTELAQTGSLTSIDELARLDLTLASPEEAGPAALPAPTPEGPAAPPEGASEVPGPTGGEIVPPSAAQPNHGDRLSIEYDGGRVEGHVVGYDPDSGHPMMIVDHGFDTHHIGDVMEVPPELAHRLPPEAAPESTGGPARHISTTGGPKLLEGPARTMGDMLPTEFEKRFPGVSAGLYVKTMEAALDAGHPIPEAAILAHPELREIAMAAEESARMQEAKDSGVVGTETPVMDFIRQRGGVDLAVAKRGAAAGYGELKDQDMLNRGLIRRGGVMKGFDVAAQQAFAAGLIPEETTNALLEAIDHEARRRAFAPMSVRDASVPYESKFPQQFEPGESWAPERLKAAMDEAKLVTGSAVTSKGFSDKTFGRVARGQKGKLLGTDLENGQMLAQFGEKVVIADPRDIAQTYNADKKLKAEPLDSTVQGRAVKESTHTAAGLEDDPKVIEMTEKAMLSKQLRDKAAGSIIGARHGYNEAFTALMGQIKAGKEVRGVLAKFASESLVGLRISSTEARTIMKQIATAKDEAGLVKGLNMLHEVTSANYKRQVIKQFVKVLERTMDAPGVEVRARQMAKAMADKFDFKRKTNEEKQTLNDLREYVATVRAFAPESAQAAAFDDLVKMVSRKSIDDMSEAEAEEALDTAISIEEAGREAQKIKEMVWKFRVMSLDMLLSRGAVPLEKSVLAEHVPGTPRNPEGLVRAAARKTYNFAMEVGLPFNMPYSLMDLFDGGQAGKGPHTTKMLDPISSTYRDGLDQIHQLERPIHEAMEHLKLKPEEEERVAIVLQRNQEGGMNNLVATGGLAAMDREKAEAYVNSIKLSAREQQAHDVAVAGANTAGKVDALRELMARVFNEDFKPINGTYFPRTVQYVPNPDTVSMVDALTMDLDPSNPRARKSLEKGMTKERIENSRALKLQVWEPLLRHIYNREMLLAMGERMKMIGEVVNRPSFEKAHGDIGTRLIRGWVSLVSRQGHVDGQARRFSRAIGVIKSNVGAYEMGMNLGATFLQATHYPYVFNEVGPRLGMIGLARASTPAGRAFLEAHSPEWREREKAWKRFENIDGKSIWANVKRTAFWGFLQSDREFAGAAWLAGYQRDLESRGLDFDPAKFDRAAGAAAEKVMVKTQGSPLFKDMALALSTNELTGVRELNRMVLQYQTFKITRLNYLMHEVYRNRFQKGDWSGGASNLGWLLLMTAGADLGIKYGYRKIKDAVLAGAGWAHQTQADFDWSKKLIGWSLDQIPLVGQAYQGIEYGHWPIPALAAAAKVGAGVYGVAHGGAKPGQNPMVARRAELHNTAMALEGLAALAGVPAGSSIAAGIKGAVGSGGPARPARRGR